MNEKNKIELDGLSTYLLEYRLTIFAVFLLAIIFVLMQPNTQYNNVVSGGFDVLAKLLFVGPLTMLAFITISIFSGLFYKKNAIKKIITDKKHKLIGWPFIIIAIIGIFLVIANLGDLTSNFSTTFSISNFSMIFPLDWLSLYVAAGLYTALFIPPLFIAIILLPIITISSLKQQKTRIS